MADDGESAEPDVAKRTERGWAPRQAQLYAVVWFKGVEIAPCCSTHRLLARRLEEARGSEACIRKDTQQRLMVTSSRCRDESAILVCAHHHIGACLSTAEKVE